MSRFTSIGVVTFLTGACGAAHSKTPTDAVEAPKARVQIAAWGSHNGYRLTVTADPLPVPTSDTILGTYPNQYEMTVLPEELMNTKFDVLAVDAREHLANKLETISLRNALFMLDGEIERRGAPSIVGIELSTSDPFDPVPEINPRIARVAVQWSDGGVETIIYD